MKKNGAIIIFLAGLIAVGTTLTIVFDSDKPQMNSWILIVLWTVALITGFIIASNAISIDKGAKQRFNLVKFVYVPLFIISFLVYGIFDFLHPLLFSVFTGSFGLLFGGYLLIRDIAR